LAGGARQSKGQKRKRFFLKKEAKTFYQFWSFF